MSNMGLIDGIVGVSTVSVGKVVGGGVGRPVSR